MKLWSRCLLAACLAGGALLVEGCPQGQPPVEIHGQVGFTILHTADIHSRLFPYDLQIGTTDSKLGLGPYDSVSRVGGVAKIAHILDRERARADRVLHMNCGDSFQGAPIFNFFSGEAEMRSMSEMGTDVMVIANHEFDKGALNVANQIERWATFPVLAANYRLDTISNPGNAELGRVLVPWTSFDLDGLKVGAIGMANFSTLGTLFQQPNSFGIIPLNTQQVAQFYVDLIRPFVDVVVVMSHLGLEYDEAMIAQTSGIDVVLGSHNHIVLQPPKQIDDCQNVDENGNHYINIVSGEPQADDALPVYEQRRCNPRKVLLAHSGAFSQFVGRLDFVLSDQQEDIGPTYDPINRMEVIESNYTLIPITNDLPDDPHMVATLQPYQAAMGALIDLDLIVGYAPAKVPRSASGGGDSMLGNMVADSIWLRQGVQSDFSLTNTSGIRADIVQGPVTIDELYQIFPFDNAITKMQLSGDEVQQMFDFVARRSASRGCVSQAQIAGARVTINCVPGCTRADLTPACSSDADCPFGAQCDTTAGKCKPQPCADHIYVGAEPDHKCMSDADCGRDANGNVFPNICDTFTTDADGYGRCYAPIDPIATYSFATIDYLANGGSGFSVLRRNTTQLATGIQQRDSLTDFIRQGHPCLWDASNGTDDGLKACSTDADCGDTTHEVCACTGHVMEQSDGTCTSNGDCGGMGRCVLLACRNDVAAFHQRTCTTDLTTPATTADCITQLNPCELGGEECKFLSCVDKNVGAFSDARVLMEGQ
jgi:5'-nucleotidase